MKILKIFLASSSELKTEREQFEIFIYRKCKDWLPNKQVFLHLEIWEDFLDAISPTRLQDEYNKAIRECDLFVMLCHTKVGKYTEEEFSTAFGRFVETQKPFIFTYFKDYMPDESDKSEQTDSLICFQERLLKLGHFYTVFKNTDNLKFQFNHQLDLLAGNGFTKNEAVESPNHTPATVQTAEKIYNIGKIDTANFS